MVNFFAGFFFLVVFFCLCFALSLLYRLLKERKSLARVKQQPQSQTSAPKIYYLPQSKPRRKNPKPKSIRLEGETVPNGAIIIAERSQILTENDIKTKK